MTEINDIPLDDLVQSWRTAQEEYAWGPDDAHDQAVLDCVARLAADPTGGTSYIWVLGLTMLAPYLTEGGEDHRPQAVAALRATDAALRERPCDHDTHPYESHDGHDGDEGLPDLLLSLADDSEEWYEDDSREAWCCPRNVAGYARIALDIQHPGEVPDVPPRLSLMDREQIKTLESVLELYPDLGTDVEDEIATPGATLRFAEPEDRAGCLHVVRAVSWHAVSGMILDRSVLDNLIEGVETVLPDFAEATCDHDEHPRLSGHSTHAAELGIVLSSPAGRALYASRPDRYGDGSPLERMVCPAFMAEVARDTLTELRAGRDRIFGPRDVAHLDAEYLREDGRLDIEKIADRLQHVGRNAKYADDLGLWAARRYDGLRAGGGAGAGGSGRHMGREQAVLLVTAYRAMEISYPSPPYAVAVGVLATMRTVAAAPRPDRCAHPDTHPPLSGDDFREALPHFYAPDEHPPTGDVRGVESWTCPRFAATIAEKCVGILGDLYKEEDDGGL
ncbi:hypothetical protein ACWD4G_12925 [Streptomyces sp. NPDC002643]